MKYIRRVVFLTVLVSLAWYVASVLERKNSYSDMMCNFESLPYGMVDVLCVGSSHLYCTVNPVEMYRRKGIRAYVLGTRQQPPEVSYDYIRRAMERQPISTVVLETFMFAHDVRPFALEEGVVHDSLDPLTFSLDKVRLAKELWISDDIENHVIPFMKYHCRRRELVNYDFRLLNRGVTVAKNFGFPIFHQSKPSPIQPKDCQSVDPVALDEYYLLWLDRIRNLVSEKGACLVLLSAPYCITSEELRRHRAIFDYAQKHGLGYVDMNKSLENLLLKRDEDFFDPGHLNVLGAEKASRFVADQLSQIVGAHVETNQDQNVRALWEKECARYDTMKAAALLKGRSR